MSRKRRHRLQQKKLAETRQIQRPEIEARKEPEIKISGLPELQQIPPELVEKCWPLCVGFITAGLRGSDYTLAEMQDLCANGDAQLWFAWNDPELRLEAAMATCMMETPRGKVCVLEALGGKRMDRWLGLLDQIEAWARAEGCTLMRTHGRRGWARVLHDYALKRVVLEKDL